MFAVNDSDQLSGEGSIVLGRSLPHFRNDPSNLAVADGVLFQDEKCYETLQSNLVALGSTRVSSDSVVYLRGQLVAETVVVNEQIGYYRWRHLAKKLLASKSVSLPSGRKYLLLTDSWSAGHFHWFMEVLPKVLLMEPHAREFVLLLPDTPYTRTIGVESLNLLGIEFEDIVWMRDEEFYKVPDLYYLTRIAAPGQVNDDLMKELNRRFHGDRPAGTTRGYISRSETRRRKVLNEAELEPVLQEFGFETLRPENLSLLEQINIFAECEALMGIHGAGLTNCLFMSPGGSLVELRKREPNYGYWHLADSVGHKYYYSHGVADSDLSLIGHGCNLTIPVEDFRRTILEPFF